MLKLITPYEGKARGFRTSGRCCPYGLRRLSAGEVVADRRLRGLTSPAMARSADGLCTGTIGGAGDEFLREDRQAGMLRCDILKDPARRQLQPCQGPIPRCHA